jgi:hypothetical protein
MDFIMPFPGAAKHLQIQLEILPRPPACHPARREVDHFLRNSKGVVNPIVFTSFMSSEPAVLEEAHQIIVIRRTKPSRPSVAQTMIDHERSNERRRRVGPLYDQMCVILTRLTSGKLNRAILLGLAEQLAKQKGITVDRTAKRLKDCLICWFCENCQELLWQPRRPPTPPLIDRDWMEASDPGNCEFVWSDAENLGVFHTGSCHWDAAFE